MCVRAWVCMCVRACLHGCVFGGLLITEKELNAPHWNLPTSQLLTNTSFFCFKIFVSIKLLLFMFIVAFIHMFICILRHFPVWFSDSSKKKKRTDTCVSSKCQCDVTSDPLAVCQLHSVTSALVFHTCHSPLSLAPPLRHSPGPRLHHLPLHRLQVSVSFTFCSLLH